jgi:hypothetical protein
MAADHYSCAMIDPGLHESVTIAKLEENHAEIDKLR